MSGILCISYDIPGRLFDIPPTPVSAEFVIFQPWTSPSPFTPFHPKVPGMAYEDSFVWTPALVNLSNRLWAINGMIGAALCGVVLVVIGVLALNPVSRPHLDRVSFRILVWTLLANSSTVFGITNAVGGNFTGPTWACGFDIFLLQLTLEMSSFLLFCIALNLQLVVVHQINGQKLEKFYICGSILISLCVTAPPFALKQYGWDPLVKDCWYSANDPKQRLAWQIGTQLFWTLLTVTGELVTTVTVVIYMVQQQVWRKSAQAFSDPRTQSRSRSSSVDLTDAIPYANIYRGVILRIVRYPIVSALVNVTSVACVIHATREEGIKNWTDYRVLLLSDFVYGGRAILYAFLAATDPAFVRAVRAWLLSHDLLSPQSSTPVQPQSFRWKTDSRHVLSVHMEVSTVNQNQNGKTMVVNHHSVSPTVKFATPDSEDVADPGKLASMLKPRSDIEASPRPRQKDLPPVPPDEQRHGRMSLGAQGFEDGAPRQQQLAMERERESNEFQRRI
ncbi:hypothetical protein B0H19DRAFT_1242965 [Mycena capillaripes]|nr:hypothetical protein B0H19DRAFT_1242965 [Mycena capillaripes]